MFCGYYVYMPLIPSEVPFSLEPLPTLKDAPLLLQLKHYFQIENPKMSSILGRGQPLQDTPPSGQAFRAPNKVKLTPPPPVKL